MKSYQAPEINTLGTVADITRGGFGELRLDGDFPFIFKEPDPTS